MKEREIFDAALAIADPDERDAFLNQACNGDPGLKEHLRGLLEMERKLGRFLELPDSPPTMDFDSSPLAEGPGTVIGPYKLREQIGEGGMGVVCVAEQTQPVRRKVALKIIKPGMDTRQVIARFEAERQALAMMDHPNIARVHDGGATKSGRPYFVMELVRGIPITEYCDRERLSIPERLELVVQVCRAVQHAHQKGIIHRDLKPSNILVTIIDGVAVPKVIDFGVAKATGSSLTERTVYTAFHQFIGTPLYMSPEQADLSGMDVDTRSDIYSLGVLLYELLTGTTPFDQETFRQAAFDEVRRIIREQEPPRPSTRLSTLEATATTSSSRKSDPRSLSKLMRGELDWIVMKCLEKNRTRRYETAGGLALDIRRYLDDQPVEAHPPSVAYRFGKFARRHRASLTSTALIVSALVVGTTVSAWQAVRAARAAEEARERADEFKQVIDYLAGDVFGAAAQGKASRRSVTIGELMDRADTTLLERFRERPLVEASVRMALATSYEALTDYTRARRNATRAVEVRERYLGPEHPATIDALERQAWSLCQSVWGGGGDPSYARLAEPIFRRVLAVRLRALGPAHPQTLWTQVGLAITISNAGRHDEAEPKAAQSMQLAIDVLGREHDSTLFAMWTLGGIAERRGDLARPEALLRQAYIKGSGRGRPPSRSNRRSPAAQRGHDRPLPPGVWARRWPDPLRDPMPSFPAGGGGRLRRDPRPLRGLDPRNAGHAGRI
jgi:serine/threonine protein kinase